MIGMLELHGAKTSALIIPRPPCYLGLRLPLPTGSRYTGFAGVKNLPRRVAPKFASMQNLTIEFFDFAQRGRQCGVKRPDIKRCTLIYFSFRYPEKLKSTQLCLYGVIKGLEITGKAFEAPLDFIHKNLLAA